MDEFNELFDKAVDIVSSGEKALDSGILGLYFFPDPKVHLSESAFFEKYGNEHLSQPFSLGGTEHFVILVNGVKVFCISGNEVNK